MSFGKTARAEAPLAFKYALVSIVGFVTDFSVLQLGVRLGLAPAWARIISLSVAMQVTFWVNGLLVFRCLDRRNWGGAWLAYMATNGFGNFCNYWVFVSLVSLHRPLLSNHAFALAMGGWVAWNINYLCARFLIFGAKGKSGGGCLDIREVIKGVAGRIAALTCRGHAAHETAPATDAAAPPL